MPSESASQYSQTESKITEALSSVSEHPPNLSELAHRFDVPYDRLRWRYLGNPSRSTRKPVGTKLTEQQESEIVNRISELDHHSVKQIADQILERDHIGDYPPPTVRYKWCQRFLERYNRRFKGEVNF